MFDIEERFNIVVCLLFYISLIAYLRYELLPDLVILKTIANVSILLCINFIIILIILSKMKVGK
jgi:hypothetical protein